MSVPWRIAPSTIACTSEAAAHLSPAGQPFKATGTPPAGVAQHVGFGTAGESKGSYDRMKSTVQQELKQHFRPEFLNRVDDTIVFHLWGARTVPVAVTWSFRRSARIR